MKRFVTIYIVLLSLWSVFPLQAFPQEKMTPVKVADGVYMFENSRGSGNSTVVITDDGVLVLDFHIANADQMPYWFTVPASICGTTWNWTSNCLIQASVIRSIRRLTSSG